MQKNKIFKTLIITLIMLFLGIFCQTKTVEAFNFHVYDPRTGQQYQVKINGDIDQAKEKLSEITGLQKNSFNLINGVYEEYFLLTVVDHYFLELPINQVVKDGVLYNIFENSNQEVFVAGLADDNLEAQEVVIASEINHLKVTKIGSGAFAHTKIRSVTFEPNSAITSLNPDEDNYCFGGRNHIPYCGCFAGCTSLTNITLPDSLTSIKEGDFKDCTNLQQVNIRNCSQLHLRPHAFKNTKVDMRKLLSCLRAIHIFQNAEKRRAERLASMINLTDQKYKSELCDIYSLLNHHCHTDDLIFAYEALTRKIGFSLGEDNPDFIKMKQGRKYYQESLSRIERERALEMMKIESYK